MTTITKLKAALEAIEEIYYTDATTPRKQYAAIKTLRSVIAEMEAGEPVAWRKKDTGQLEGAKAFAQPYNWGDKTKWEPLFTHPQPKAEPVQEPVAWITQSGNLVRENEKKNAELYGWKPLFTHPQPKAAPVNARLAAFEDIAAVATVGATYPELMEYLKSEIDAAQIAQPKAEPVQEPHKGCACRWDADDNRVATCVRHQGWLDVVQEWADRAKAAEAAAPQAKPLPLTQEEIDRCIEAADARWADAFVPVQWARHLAKAIEAAHGIA